MLDEGKISQSEYDIVKTEVLEAPAEEWESPTAVAPPEEDEDKGPDDEKVAGWRGAFDQIPTIYRVRPAERCSSW